MTPTITLDANRALARFSPAGIPAQVRANLRRTIPSLAKRLGAQVDANLDTGLRSRNRLKTNIEMVENPHEIIGRVSVTATAPPALLPQWLNTGTRPHPIVARNAPMLVFFWERLGRWVAFKSVFHPGFAGIHYMDNAFRSMEGQILDGIDKAVRDGVRR